MQQEGIGNGTTTKMKCRTKTSSELRQRLSLPGTLSNRGDALLRLNRGQQD